MSTADKKNAVFEMWDLYHSTVIPFLLTIKTEFIVGKNNLLKAVFFLTRIVTDESISNLKAHVYM